MRVCVVAAVAFVVGCAGGAMVVDDESQGGEIQDAGPDGLEAEAVEFCGIDEVVKTCEYCQQNGCQMASKEPERCYVGVVHYTDMLGCAQWPEVQTNCSSCVGVTFGSVLSLECVNCASQHSPCTFDCKKASGAD